MNHRGDCGAECGFEFGHGGIGGRGGGRTELIVLISRIAGDVSIVEKRRVVVAVEARRFAVDEQLRNQTTLVGGGASVTRRPCRAT